MRRAPSILLEFRERASRCETKEELARLIEDVARELGFDFVAILHSHSLCRRGGRLIRYENYPADWDLKLVGRGQVIVDPILAIARRRAMGFLWSDALVAAQLSAGQKRILDEAHRCGIRQGFTVPANVPGEPEGSINFATRSTRVISRSRQHLADEVGHAAFEEARRIMDYGNRPLPLLSRREREVIRWIARGKIDADIAVIFGRGIETVRTYVKSAMRKLDVVTRAQLIETALRVGVIDFAVSIPPLE